MRLRRNGGSQRAGSEIAGPTWRLRYVTEVSVATWNLHQAMDKRPDNVAATWRYLKEEVRPTVALVQEAIANSIPTTTGGNVFLPANEVPYETAVVAYAGDLRHP